MRRSPYLIALAAPPSVFAASFLVTLALSLVVGYARLNARTPRAATSTTQEAAPAPQATSTSPAAPEEEALPRDAAGAARAPYSFIYSFNASGVLEEAARASFSTSPFWFLDSGGELIVGAGEGATLSGIVPAGTRWHDLYARNNPVDTDGGTHPQNIFRLLTKAAWDSTRVELSYFINADHLSASPNRNASNGLLLMSRYQDHDTLYYAGIRVDGTAVIKKKYHGTYYTVAQTQVFPGTYDPASSPDLLPHGTWLRLRMDTETDADGFVAITLSLKRAGDASFTPLLTALDDGRYGGTPPIASSGLLGIRTDFMDVRFADFRVETL